MIGAAVGLAHQVFKVAAPVLKALAPWFLCALLGIAVFYYVPVFGAKATLDRLEAKRAKWEQAATDYRLAANGWESSFRSSEAVRVYEHRKADAALASAAKSCAAEVAAARRSARAIETIVIKEPVYDPSGCPVRSVVPADLLREALAPH